MRDLLEKATSPAGLDETEARRLASALTSGNCDPLTAAGALAAMATRGETATEIRAFAETLQGAAHSPSIDNAWDAVDVVGTGGDRSRSLNLSTGSALVAAAAGVPVIKHGGRSVSSASGSFDVLSALGLDLPWDADLAGSIFQSTGFTYLFAPTFHPAMANVAHVRQSLGIRTIFNLVGPLANPARPAHMVVGAFSRQAARMMAETLSGMDIERAFVVHGEPGWDEATPVGPYLLFDVRPGFVHEVEEDPAQVGFARCSAADLTGEGPAHNARALRRVFEGAPGPHRDALILGASLAMRVRGEDPNRSIEMAASAIDDGAALALLERLADLSRVEPRRG
jgi:anthranilate phosphoribosyltransferase